MRASADGEKLFEMKRTASELETGTEYAANYHFENERLTMIHTNAIHLVLRKQDYDNEAVVRMEIAEHRLQREAILCKSVLRMKMLRTLLTL